MLIKILQVKLTGVVNNNRYQIKSLIYILPVLKQNIQFYEMSSDHI